MRLQAIYNSYQCQHMTHSIANLLDLLMDASSTPSSGGPSGCGTSPPDPLFPQLIGLENGRPVVEDTTMVDADEGVEARGTLRDAELLLEQLPQRTQSLRHEEADLILNFYDILQLILLGTRMPNNLAKIRKSCGTRMRAALQQSASMVVFLCMCKRVLGECMCLGT